jgi:hypothetical protein
MEMVSSEGFWITDEGKSIPYTRESCPVIISDDDWNDYFLQITIWPKNTTIEISVVSGDEGFDAETRWSDEQIYRLAKLPHAEFELPRNELIKKAIELANEKFGRVV